MSHKIPQEILLSWKTRIAELDILVEILRLIDTFEKILMIIVCNVVYLPSYYVDRIKIIIRIRYVTYWLTSHKKIKYWLLLIHSWMKIKIERRNHDRMSKMTHFFVIYTSVMNAFTMSISRYYIIMITTYTTFCFNLL